MPEENEKVEFESTPEGSVENNEQEELLESKSQASENERAADKLEEAGEDKGGEETEKTGEDTGEKKEVGYSDFLKSRNIEVDPSLIEGKKLEVKKKEVTPRTFDDIPEEDRPLFKAMSNDSFNKLKPIYLEHKKLKEENEQLKSKKPEGSASVFGHPKAFTLTKEYSEYTKEYDLAQQIKSHWQLQSAKVSRGEKWQDISMDKSGNLVLSEPKEANAEAEAQIADHLQFVREQAFESGKKLKTYIDNYGKTYDSDLQVINSAAEKYFPGYSDPKHPTSQIQKAVIDALPASFRDSPVATLLAMTAANNAILMGRLKKAQDELNKLKGVKTDVAAAQPRKGEFVNGKGGGGAVKFSDFAQRRAMGD